MYKSPIDVLVADIQHQIAKQQDDEIYKAVVSVGINVDKEELIRALQYDRGQYKKGYDDAMASIVLCEDCKSCKLCYPEKQIGKEPTPGWYCKVYGRYRRPDDFRSYGERREGE